ncbi:hypothetical protein N9123_01440 [Pseudomonadales bacterium]|jgi:hypothetical protein|nr:hypothetical protein [Pseudomonadales bacterium]|tara:strand:+ start:50 stop:634 length:585 start_codon:yes stop_codon:yes gene_type:complete
MANQSAAFGFRAMGKLGSSVNNMATSEYKIADNANLDLFQGMIVGNASGVITAGTATSAKNLGVLNGVFITKDPSTGKPTFKNQYSQTNVAAGETITAFVYDDPNTLFEVQAGGVLAQAAQGNNIDSVLGTGDTVTGRAKSTTASSVTGSGATAQFRIIRPSSDPQNNDISVADCNYVVKFNEHLYLTTTGGDA